MNGMTRGMSGWMMAGLALVASAGWARGQVTYSSSTRLVSASTNAGTQTFDTSAAGYWNQLASSNDILGGAVASQTSDLRPDGISFRSNTAAANQNGGLATSSSAFDVTFSVGITTPFELTRSTEDFLQNASLQLTKGSSTIFSFSWGLSSGNFPLSHQGVLTPGVYRLRTNLSSTASATGPDHFLNGQENFVLSIPAPGPAAVVLTGFAVASTRRRRS